jgi:Predicted amidohydrolase
MFLAGMGMQVSGRNSMKIRVAAVQMVSGPDVAANVEAAGRLVAQAAAQGAQVVLLPEYFCLISGNDRDKLGIQEVDAGEQPEADTPLQHFLSVTARQHGITLLGGTVPLKSPKIHKICNSLLVYGPDGKRLARYDKIHLFGFQRGEESYDESVAIHAGRTPVVVDVPVGAAARAVARMGAPGGADENEVASIRVGLAVCYDLRFPELFRQMAPLDLMVMPAAFTYTTGQAHWELLLRARAVEGQCWVLASGQGGTHPGSGRRTWGHSMLVDPWGEVCAVLPEGEGVVVADLDTERTAQVRESLPALRHRVI